MVKKIIYGSIPLQEVKTKVGSCFMESKSMTATCVFVQQEKSRYNSERDYILAMSPPTGITICSSKEHRQRKISARGKNKTKCGGKTVKIKGITISYLLG